MMVLNLCIKNISLHVLQSMTDERTVSTGPTASGILKQLDQPKLLLVLCMLVFMLPHLLERAIYCIEEVQERKQSLIKLKRYLVSCNGLSEKSLTVVELTQSYTERHATSIKKSTQSCFNPGEMLFVIGAFSIFNNEDFPSDQNSQQFKVFGLNNIV